MKIFTVFSVKHSLSPIILPVVWSKLPYLSPKKTLPTGEKSRVGKKEDGSFIVHFPVVSPIKIYYIKHGRRVKITPFEKSH